MQYLKGHTDLGVVYDENGPIGGIYMLWSKYSALCTHAGSGGVESKLYGGMKHLHYAMMLRMKERGVKLYDLVGVRINSSNAALQGVFRFKKGFGGILREGYLWKTDLSPLPRIYDLVLLLKNRGRKAHGDIIDQERSTAAEKPLEHV
jgi:lipid II:glycine glycyltransferase (peptidoglycan interpeptide bridge formation enzyme)